MPVLEVVGADGAASFVPQSGAALRLVGGLAGDAAGLYPSDPAARHAIDAALDCLGEVGATLSASIRKGSEGGGDAAPDDVKARRADEQRRLRVALVEQDLPRVYGHLERLAARSGGRALAADGALTVADLSLACQAETLTRGLLDHVSVGCLEPYPHCRAIRDRVLALPEIVAWRARAEPPKAA